MRRREVSADKYVFESARIRALENHMIGETQIKRLQEAGSQARCEALLEELGVDVIRDPESGRMDRERTLERRLQTAYREVLSLTDQADFLKLWLYPYDCNNIKAIIKCRHRGVEAEGLLFDFGSVSLEKLKTLAEGDEYELLPSPFGAAAAEAAQALAATGNPQTVDLILDRACYSGMAAMAQACGVSFAHRLVQQKIDLTNLIICLRRIRSADRYVREILPQELVLEGGTLTYGDLREICQEGEAHFWKRLECTPYDKFSYRCGNGVAVGQAELAADNLWMEQIQDARRIPYGAEPLLGYLLGCEYEVRNLRILLSGYSLPEAENSVWERIRRSYV